MRPYRAFYMPDMWNNWHWYICDANSRIVTQSNQPHFHLVDAQKEAELVMSYSMAG